MPELLISDNEFSYFSDLQKIECEESIEVGYCNGQHIALVGVESLTSDEIKDFLFLNKIRTKYGKLQRASDSYRM